MTLFLIFLICVEKWLQLMVTHFQLWLKGFWTRLFWFGNLSPLGYFSSWTLFRNTGLNMSPSDSAMSNLHPHLGYSTSEFQVLQLIVLAVFRDVDKRLASTVLFHFLEIISNHSWFIKFDITETPPWLSSCICIYIHRNVAQYNTFLSVPYFHVSNSVPFSPSTNVLSFPINI